MMKQNETKQKKVKGWGGNVTRKTTKDKGFPHAYSDSHSSTEDNAGTCGQVPLSKRVK